MASPAWWLRFWSTRRSEGPSARSRDRGDTTSYPTSAPGMGEGNTGRRRSQRADGRDLRRCSGAVRSLHGHVGQPEHVPHGRDDRVRNLVGGESRLEPLA